MNASMFMSHFVQAAVTAIFLQWFLASKYFFHRKLVPIREAHSSNMEVREGKLKQQPLALQREANVANALNLNSF